MGQTMILGWQEGVHRNEQFLDTIDFIPYLNTCDTVEELMSKVESDHVGPDEFGGIVFNYIGEEELISYLYKRYDNQYVFVEDVVTINYIQKVDLDT